MKRTQRKGDVFSQRRLLLAGGLITLTYLGLMARLTYLQGFQGRKIRAAAFQSRIEDIPSKAHRGAIFDAEDRPLAIDTYSGTAGFDPAVLANPFIDSATRKRLQQRLTNDLPRAAMLLGIPLSQLNTQIQQAVAAYQQRLAEGHYAEHGFYPLKYGLTQTQAQLFKAAHLCGFGVQDNRVRRYLCGADAAQVIGFVNASGQGVLGLEQGCNRWLKGTDGYAEVELDAHRHEIPNTLHQLRLANNGLNIYTTLDADAQHIATEEAMRIWNQFHPHGVSVVVVDPRSGDIRALVSLPSFNPNPLPNAPQKRSPIPFDSIYDRCTAYCYEPGSTIKPLLVCGALQEGVITPQSYFHCSGEFRVQGRTIHCAHGEVHGDEDVAKILRVSCNIGAAQIGLRLGGQQLKAIYARFGLFTRPDLPLPGIARGHWSLDKYEAPYCAAKTARAAFGQSVTVTPLGLAMAYAAIANNGLLMQPRLVTALVSSDGRVVERIPPTPVRQVVSPSVAREVRQMLCGVVTSGTGQPAAIPGYIVAGKTGTATKYRPGAYIGSFIGMVPADPNTVPRAVILVMVNQPTTGRYYGAEVAAPAFHNIAARLMALWRVPQDDPQNTQAIAAGQLPKVAFLPSTLPTKTNRN
ncbi:peptidoglycan D,D-transpeptidase FtsI family protein [Chthonomonas calidirosea]|uniref:peptidoglycan D,D-transpeptidase FtsI family protein n=1 Tax=Chthonomonas calidirosea TaxID=454171 RepID=UPI0006ECC7EE|nr:penicillin-binding protein 2 [Chthonomonas calidirosea]CEK12765.1 cell division protein FtsI/penicillin-binding protein 2 [Chthonomonas calidirosea]